MTCALFWNFLIFFAADFQAQRRRHRRGHGGQEETSKHARAGVHDPFVHPDTGCHQVQVRQASKLETEQQ